MSEYLELLKRRRDATPPPGNAPNVQSNVSFRKAIDYIERLEKQLAVANAVAEMRGEQIRDGFEIYQQTRNDLSRICKELDVANKQRDADAASLIDTISQHYLDCDDAGIAFGISSVQRLINEYYEYE